MSHDVDVSGLPEHVRGRAEAAYWGMWGLVAVEATFLGSLIASYFYLGSIETQWPPPATQSPGVVIPVLATLVVLGAVPYAWYSDRLGHTKRRSVGLPLSLAATVALGVVFVLLVMVSAAELPFRWDSHAYGSTVFVILGFITLHAVACVLVSAAMMVLAFRGFFAEERSIGTQASALLWYVLLGFWLAVFVVVYLTPRFWS